MPSYFFCFLAALLALCHCGPVFNDDTRSNGDDDVHPIPLIAKETLDQAEEFLKAEFIHGQQVVSGSPNERKLSDRITGRKIQRKDKQSRSQRQRRKVDNDLWSSAFGGAAAIQYTFDQTNTWGSNQATAEQAIRNEIAKIETNTCIKFEEVAQGSATTPYMLFKSSSSGCGATIGQSSDGVSEVRLLHTSSASCLMPGIIAHEILHALGFHHEVKRTDRDDFITLNTANILSGKLSQFNIATDADNLAPYDYESIMQYSPRDFAISTSDATFDAHGYEFLTGQRVKLSFYDWMTVNKAYQCLDTCNHITCANDGYPLRNSNGQCQCRCPDYLGGATCDQIISDAGCGGSFTFTSIGESMTISINNTPEADTRTCVYFVKGLPGKVVKVHPSTFDMGILDNAQNPQNTLEIRSNLIGQTGLQYGGRTIFRDVFTQQTDNIMMIYREEDNGAAGTVQATLEVTATDENDPCQSDPCFYGATCVYSHSTGSHVCLCPPNYTGNDCSQLSSTDTLTDDFENSWFPLMWNVEGDDFDWTRHRGTTSSSGTGPSQGHNGSPNYVYAEASFPVKKGYKAILASTAYLSLDADRCLSFAYHMYGTSVGSLTLELHYSDGSPVEVPFMVDTNLGDQWITESIDISARPGGVAVMPKFVYTRNGYKGDVGLDDISTWLGPCETIM